MSDRMPDALIYRSAEIEDLPAIVAIYNSTIPGRMVTADTTAVTVNSKIAWFQDHNPKTRPLWIVEMQDKIIGWVSFQDFYSRPAYQGTAEISIYLAETARGKGCGKLILKNAIEAAPSLGIDVLIGFIFGHNAASLSLFSDCGFEDWGMLPAIALMDQQRFDLKILGRKV